MTLVTPTIEAVLTRIRAFLLTIVPPGTPVVQGYQNRVAQPNGAHIVMTPLFEQRLRTNLSTYDDDGYTGSMQGQRLVEQGTEVHVQLDFYGPPSGEWAAMTSTLWRDEYGVDLLAPDCAPLYIDNARRMPFVTGEEQYYPRYSSTAVLQYNPVTAIPQQFADEASATVIDVETLPVA